MRRLLTGTIILGAVLLGLTPAVAHADGLNVTYYTIAPNDLDADHLAGGVFNNEVQSAL
jgi:hypothetical protein